MRKYLRSVAVLMAWLVLSLPVCMAMDLSYDGNGNLVSGDGKYRVYNGLNQLYRVYNGSSTSGLLLSEFVYHPVDERVLMKKSYNITGGLFETVYYWSDSLLTVVNSSGNYNFTFVVQNGDLVGQLNPDGTKLFVHSDHEGSSSVVTNSSGTVVERNSYSPYGEVLSGGRLNRFDYESKETDNGLGTIPTNGLVSYWSLEGSAVDSVLGNHGNVTNATVTDGKVRGAFNFDASADYIAVSDSSSLDLTNGISVSAWIYVKGSNQGYILQKQNAYLVQYTGGVVQGGIYIGGTFTNLAQAAVSLNTWTHVVFTYNKSNAVMYVNGASAGTGTNTNTIDTNNNPLWLGARNQTDRLRDFNGTIDEVGLWNRALSSSEVLNLFRYGQAFESGFRSTDFHARMYNPELVVMEQPDTLIPNVYDPQSLNRYMFERGNPYARVDPDGHNPYLVAGVLGFAYGTVSYGYTHQGEGRGSFGDFVSYMGRGIGHGLIASGAAFASVSVGLSGGRIAAQVGVSQIGRLFGIGAGEYALHQSIDGEQIDPLDALVSGAINTANPFGEVIPTTPGSFVSMSNSLSRNSLKLTTQLILNSIVASGVRYKLSNSNSYNLLNQIISNTIHGTPGISFTGKGSGFEYKTKSGRTYPNAAPNFVPNENTRRICVSGC